ncbi:MAG TPA: hypothetical protein VMZ71_08090, partial [Gemmataceae bacterium]|nr:hypothetical protein [Gemmataceae bacterium]
MVATLPFLVSGEHPDDMGMLANILPDYGPPPTFEGRWSKGVEFHHDRFRGLIILGDSSDNRATYRALEKEQRWLLKAMEAKRPVLGICFGAQMLAAFQNRGRRAGGLSGLPRLHVGVCPVELRDDGLTDPVLKPLRRHPFVTMSHEDCFQKPEGTEPLAWSACEGVNEHCEAFRIGPPSEAVYGFQFHPEPTLDMLRDAREGRRWFDVV